MYVQVSEVGSSAASYSIIVTPVRIPVVCQSIIGVAYTQLTISNDCETGNGLAYSLRISLVL